MKYLIQTGLTSLSLLSGGLLFAQESPAPPLDPEIRESINQSYNFLLNREPEMTPAEFALYQQVLPMVFEEPEVATMLLESMLADDDPESPAFSYVLANVYFSNEQYALAEKHFQSAVKAYPDFLRAWVNLAFLYYNLENYKEAIPCLVKALSLGSRDPQVQGMLGYCLVETGNPLAAEAAFLQAFSIDPQNSDWIEALLSLYLDTRQLDRAEPLLRQLIQLDPKVKANWTLYSSMLLSANRKLDAIVILETLKEYGLADMDDNLLLGDLYAQQGLFAEALATYGIIAQSDASVGADRLLQYARVLTEAGSFAQAELLLAEAETVVTPVKRPDLMLAQCRLLLAQKKQALASMLLDEILNMDPLCGEALLERGRLHAKQGEIPEAEFLLDQAVKVPDFAFRANVALANIALNEHHYQKGIDYLQAAYKLEQRPEIEAHIQRLTSILSSPAQ